MSKKRKGKKFVTVCLANAARSPTAEWLLLGQGNRVKSCGTAKSFAIRPCDRKLMKWADRVFVMEPYQEKALHDEFPESRGKITMLDIPEIGEYTCDISLLKKISRALNREGAKTRSIGNLDRAQEDCIIWTAVDRERKLRKKYARPATKFWSEEATGYVPAWHIEEGMERIIKADLEEEEAIEKLEKARRDRYNAE